MPHPHTHAGRRLGLSLVLTLAFAAAEAVAGFWAHSLALLSDAGHNLADALALSWYGVRMARKPADARRTFGYHRVGILTALGNGLTLVVIAAVIAVEAYRRFAHPQPVQPAIMVAAGLLAIAVNLYIGWGLSRSAHANLNARAAALHVFGDVGASAGVILGALIIALTGAAWVDPLVSVLIATLIALGALRLIGEAANILLESTPRDVSLSDLVRDMLRVPGVHDVHDLHVWTISSGMLALSCHAVIDDLPPSDSAPILDRITEMLRRDYTISHSTVQFESEVHTSHEGCACQPETCERLYCDLRLPDSEHEHAHP